MKVVSVRSRFVVVAVVVVVADTTPNWRHLPLTYIGPNTAVSIRSVVYYNSRRFWPPCLALNLVLFCALS